MVEHESFEGSEQQLTNAERVKVLSDVLDRLNEIVGTPFEMPEGEYSEEDLLELQRKNVEDGRFTTYLEQSWNNSLIFRNYALQREAEITASDVPTEEQIHELIVANRVATYHEYLGDAVYHVLRIFREYESLREVTPNIPLELQKEEEKMRIYIVALQKILQERTAFANVILADGMLAEHRGNQRILLSIRDDAYKILSPESKAALKGDVRMRRIHGNALNQEIISILSGKHSIEGLEEGFLPQKLYFDLLKHQYEVLLEEQAEIAQDQNLVETETRVQILQEKHELAKQGIGEFTEKDVSEYERLKDVLKDRSAELEAVQQERDGVLGEMLKLAGELGRYQLAQAEIATIQQQFGKEMDFENATDPLPDTTPEHIYQSIEEYMDIRSTYHLDRMNGMMDVLENDVLSIGVHEIVEDLSNDYGRELVRKVAHAVATVVTLPVTEEFGLKQSAMEALTGSLDEALGWPKGKDRWEDLSPDEQKVVEEKAKSILDAIHNFDRTSIVRVRETTEAIRAMPHAGEYVGEEIQDPLPTERVLPENREELIQQYGGATVYVMLFRQMQEDWGSTESHSGFLGEYAKFMQAANENVSEHINVAEALYEIAKPYENMMRYMLYMLAIGLGIGAVSGALLAQLGVKAARGTMKIGGHVLRMGGRGAMSIGKGTLETVQKIARMRPPKALEQLRVLRTERKLAHMLRNTRFGKLVYPQLRFLQVSRLGARGGSITKGLGWALVPAIAAWEIYETEQRKGMAEGNAEMQQTLQDHHTATLLESTGYIGALGVKGLLQSMSLIVPVYYAKELQRARTEQRINWARTEEDWQRDFSEAALLQKLQDLAPGTEVSNDAAAYKTRLEDWTGRLFGQGEKMDREQMESFDAVASGNTATRAEIYRAYFELNNIQSSSTTRETVRDKLSYIAKRTHGGYEKVTSATLYKADVYAQVMQEYRRRKEFNSSMLLHYVDDDGNDQWLDLKEVVHPETMPSLVAAYEKYILPTQELIQYNVLGLRGDEDTVRTACVFKLLHDIHEAERSIVAIDWPGWEVSGYEGKAEQTVRWYIRMQIEKELDTLLPQLLAGNLHEKEYTKRINDIALILQNVGAVEKGQVSPAAFLKEAEKYVAKHGDTQFLKKQEEGQEHPLYGMIK